MAPSGNKIVVALALAARLVAASSPVGIAYSDWDGAEVCRPVSLSLPSSEDAIVALVVDAAGRGEQVKVVGAGHSFSGIQLTDGVDGAPSGAMMSLDRYSGITKVAWAADNSYALVTAKGGSRLHDLNPALEDLGLAFVNLGSCAAQSIAGATQTGTHGTGRLLGTMSTQITGFRLIDGLGVAHEVTAASSGQDGDLFAAGRVGLGALGVVTEVTFKAVPLFKIKETTFSLPLDEMLAEADGYYAAWERFQWNWVPYSGVAGVILREVTDDPITTGCGSWATNAAEPPRSFAVGMGSGENDGDFAAKRFTIDGFRASPPGLPLALRHRGGAQGVANTSCVDVSYKTMVESDAAYETRTLYTEMEMFIPAEDAVEAVTQFLAFQESVKDQVPANQLKNLYCQVRYVMGDDVPLSPAFGRDVAVLSMIVMGDKNATAPPELFALFAQGMEDIATTSFRGVPHWGKKNWATPSDLQAFYTSEALAAFEGLRQSLDPHGLFLNGYLRARGIGPAAGAAGAEL